MHDASSSRQRSTPSRARRQRGAASPPADPAPEPRPALSPPGPEEASEAAPQLSAEAFEPIDHERHVLAQLATQARRQPTVLTTGEQLLESGRRCQHSFDRPGRHGVLPPLRPTARGDKGASCGGGERSQPARTDVDSEGGGEHVLELMGLVDDEGIVLGQYLSRNADRRRADGGSRR